MPRAQRAQRGPALARLPAACGLLPAPLSAFPLFPGPYCQPSPQQALQPRKLALEVDFTKPATMAKNETPQDREQLR